MSVTLLLACASAYVWVAYGYFTEGRWGMGIAFIAYAVANAGFALDTWR